MNRRDILLGAGACAIGAALPASGLVLGDSKQQMPWTSLGTLAARKGILFGFALNYRLLSGDGDYDALVARECTIVTPENAMKWEGVHPESDRYTFTQADAIVDFAERHAMKVRGHTFCWHRALPAWVTREVTSANAETVLREHIGTVAGRYKGRLHSWDVVNEAIQLKDNQTGGWRNSFWYSVLGPRYVSVAFEAAHEADPVARLAYNDFGLEYDNHSDESKRKAVLTMLTDLRKQGVPIGALGLQSHLRAGTGENFAPGLPRFIEMVRDLGLEVYVTELDVDDSHLTSAGSAREGIVADVYRRYLDLILATGAVSVAITWGAWDSRKPVGAEAVSGPGAQHPLLFAPGGAPNASAFTVAESLRHALPRNDLRPAHDG